MTRPTLRPEDWPYDDTPLPEAAVIYAKKHGFRVFPTDAKTKRPLVKGWHQSATTDPQQIASWWKEHPRAGIGVVCDAQSGIAVIDLDVKHTDEGGLTGVDHYSRLRKKFGGSGRPITADTPSGGRHLFYSHHSLPFEKSEGRIAFGIDVRSARPDGSGAGYIQIAPTKGKGGQYQWREPLPLSSNAFPEAPEELAFRACFRAAERATIKATPGLYDLIVSRRRDRWRETFDVHQGTARRQDKILKQALASLKGAVPTAEHPWVKAALAGVVEDVRKADGAVRPQNAQLYVSAARSGNILAAVGCKIDDEMVEAQREALLDAVRDAPVLDPSNPWDTSDGCKKARDTIASGMNRGFENPLDLSELSPTTSRTDIAPSNAKTKKGEAVSGTRIAEVKRLSEVRPKPIEWFWPGWIAKGALTMIVGDPGVGKSQCTSDLAARASRGKHFPDEPKPPHRRAVNVILLNAEDATESVIAPRLKAAGADPEHVFVLDSVKRVREDGSSTEVEFSLSEDIATLDRLISEIGNVGIVIIDPVSAYLGKVDSHNNSEVRSVLAPLSRLAEKHNVAVVCVSHLNKGGDAKAIYRITGSLAFGAAARAVVVVGPNPEDATGKEKVFCQAKSNLSKLQPAITFSVEDVHLPIESVQTSKIRWEHIDPHLNAKTVLGGGDGKERPSARKECEEWLEELLMTKNVAGHDVKSAAENLGFSEATLRRAAKAIGVTMLPGKFQGAWVWSLPSSAMRLATKKAA